MTDCRTIVVADHHKSVFVCRTLDTKTGETELKSLPATRPELEKFLKKLPGRVRLFVEACRSWLWVSDLCEDRGFEMQLVDAAKMPEIWKCTKKTDKQDVESMFDRLLLTGRLPKAYRATRPQRELRGLTRRLEELRKHRRNTLNRIHAVIDAQGMPATKERFLEDVWQAHAQDSLPADVWLVLETLLIELGLIMELTGRVGHRVRELIASRDDSKRLQKIPGVGPIIAATIIAETANIQRFPSARAFAAYSGLVPRVRSSAGKAKTGHITRKGPSGLRWALGHAIFASVQSKQPSAATLFYKRKAKKGKPKKVAMVAAAHKLARMIYVMLTRDLPYQAPKKRRRAAAATAA